MKTLIGLLLSLLITINSHAQWKSDELGDDYEQMQLQFPDDYEGKVIATLVHKKSELPDSAQAILYVHGFSDYFFQTHMADYFTEQGYHFYAVDLRKYGRSHLEGPKWFNVRDLHEYFPEIDSSLAIIQAQVSGNICLMGHSTGGLITALYAAEHQDSKTFSSLILNSPFFDMNLSTFTENVLVPIGEFNGSFLPDMVLEGELAVYYNHSETPGKGSIYAEEERINQIIGDPVSDVEFDVIASVSTTYNALDKMYAAIKEHYENEGVHIDG